MKESHRTAEGEVAPNGSSCRTCPAAKARAVFYHDTDKIPGSPVVKAAEDAQHSCIQSSASHTITNPMQPDRVSGHLSSLAAAVEVVEAAKSSAQWPPGSLPAPLKPWLSTRCSHRWGNVSVQSCFSPAKNVLEHLISAARAASRLIWWNKASSAAKFVLDYIHFWTKEPKLAPVIALKPRNLA